MRTVTGKVLVANNMYTYSQILVRERRETHHGFGKCDLARRARWAIKNRSINRRPVAGVIRARILDLCKRGDGRRWEYVRYYYKCSASRANIKDSERIARRIKSAGLQFCTYKRLNLNTYTWCEHAKASYKYLLFVVMIDEGFAVRTDSTYR